MTEASAPGKLILAGEYAVLEGAPAIAASIDLRAEARVAAIATPDSVFFDAITGRAYFFSIDHQRGLQWLRESPGASGQLLEAVISACLQYLAGYQRIPVIRVSMNSNAFYGQAGGQSQKLGIGSSAAVAVALTGAITAEFDLQLSAAELAKLCHQAHRIFQGGKGSGIDIAAALHGGVVSAQADKDSGGLVVNDRDWPEGLFILPVWTGVSASTTELLGRVAEFRDNNPGDYSRLMLQLFDHAQQADQAWQSGEASQALAALSAYGSALQTFDYDAAIGIYTEPHNRIRDIVEREGASYKVSGAGGGDFGLAMTTSANVHEALQAALIEQNLFVLKQPFAAPGLIVES